MSFPPIPDMLAPSRKLSVFNILTRTELSVSATELIIFRDRILEVEELRALLSFHNFKSYELTHKL